MAFARADEFGNAIGVEAVKLRDGGFGNQDSGGVDSEVVATMDEAGKPSIRIWWPLAAVCRR